MRETRLFQLLMTIFAVMALVSCKESDDEIVEFPDWQKRSEQFMTSKFNMVRQQASSSSQWKVIKSYTKSADTAESPENCILVKVLQEGVGSGCPLYTDTVRVHYRGQLLASTSYKDSSDQELGLVFDKSWSTDTFNPDISTPSKFGVAAVVDGFSTALQHMHIGDRWLVYIPYQLGYSDTEKSNIPAYSTLVFDIMLAAYYKPGTKVPDWKASESLIWDVE